MFLERTTQADRSFSPENKLIVAPFLPADMISARWVTTRSHFGSLEIRN